ncbi:autoinducer 2 ABC transporter substrate-binding protein [Leucobacter sp. wl10]|uniref:autoinducer 2 ABC transporter substrate-binding protein n=1 Tax=Leucobacter sp. wl10 TaxID=2304677 RepID=UPI000E5AAABC|nr:autoinducer 2 ABC transporter substrate-binding protein [Leucobacter sp. wl10]RGE20750.1 autoinducer 2 ABC transporter substrate-binding protein [Leucobacter sp. wl10]
MRRRLVTGLGIGAIATLALTGCGQVGGGGSAGGSADGGSKGGPLTMVTVVKITGVGWFDRMEVGVNEYAQDSGNDVRQEGADDASPEKQIQIIQDLIPQAPDAITVVPNSPEALETVLGQARDQGIVVVAHEAAGIKNADIDIEAFDNKSYGAQIMDNLGQCMGGEGKYVQFVGGLTAKTHMDWVGGAYDQQQTKFPDMQRVEDPVESKEDENVAYQRTKELLAKYPDLKGIQGSAGTDVAGAARAVQEAGLADQVCVMGTSIPSVAKKYLSDGSIDKIFFWDPAMAGKAQLKIAEMLVNGEEIKDGTDLGIEGYESLTALEGYDNVFVGDAAVTVDKQNVDEYDF